MIDLDPHSLAGGASPVGQLHAAHGAAPRSRRAPTSKRKRGKAKQPPHPMNPQQIAEMVAKCPAGKFAVKTRTGVEFREGHRVKGRFQVKLAPHEQILAPPRSSKAAPSAKPKKPKAAKKRAAPKRAKRAAKKHATAKRHAPKKTGKKKAKRAAKKTTAKRRTPKKTAKKKAGKKG